MHIARRPFDREYVEQQYSIAKKGIASSREIHANGKQFVLRDMFGETYQALVCALLLDGPVEEIRAAFQLFHEVAFGKLLMGTHVGEEIVYSFSGAEHKYLVEAKNYSLTDQGWITAWFAALAMLDMGRIKELGTIDLDRVQALTKVGGSDATPLFAEMLKHLFRGDQDNFENLKRVSEAINSPSVPSVIAHYTTDIIGGQLDLLGAALLKETPYFNKVLATTLEWHVEFHAKEDPVTVESLVPLALNAICVFAIRSGIVIEHTSDYLLPRLLDGSLRGA